jgi:hypothetical protein
MGVLFSAWKNNGLNDSTMAQYVAIAALNSSIDAQAEWDKWDAVITGGVNPDYDQKKKDELELWVAMTPANALANIPTLPPPAP